MNDIVHKTIVGALKKQNNFGKRIKKTHLLNLVLIPPWGVYLKHWHSLAFVDQEPLVGDEGERLEVDDHLTDDAKVGR